MDAESYRQLKNLTLCCVMGWMLGFPRTLMDASSCQWDGCCEVPQPLWMLALVNGMDAMSYKQLKNVTAYFGTRLPNSVKQLDGCCEFP